VATRGGQGKSGYQPRHFLNEGLKRPVLTAFDRTVKRAGACCWPTGHGQLGRLEAGGVGGLLLPSGRTPPLELSNEDVPAARTNGRPPSFEDAERRPLVAGLPGISKRISVLFQPGGCRMFLRAWRSTATDRLGLRDGPDKHTNATAVFYRHGPVRNGRLHRGRLLPTRLGNPIDATHHNYPRSGPNRQGADISRGWNCRWRNGWAPGVVPSP